MSQLAHVNIQPNVGTYCMLRSNFKWTQPGHCFVGRCSEYKWKLGCKQAHLRMY